MFYSHCMSWNADKSTFLCKSFFHYNVICVFTHAKTEVIFWDNALSQWVNQIGFSLLYYMSSYGKDYISAKTANIIEPGVNFWLMFLWCSTMHSLVSYKNRPLGKKLLWQCSHGNDISPVSKGKIEKSGICLTTSIFIHQCAPFGL